MTIFLVRPDHESLATRRGIESIDLNLAFLLIKAPVATVAQTLSQLKQWNWFPNASGLTVDARESTLVFSLSGHPWALVYQLHLQTQQMWLGKSDASTISAILKVPVISYVNSDTGGWLQYHFYQAGILRERLHSEASDTGDQIEFQSDLTQIEQPIHNAYLFTLNFLQSQDAYIPALVVDDGVFGSDQSIILEIGNLFPEELERMDYLTNL
ncbi:MAG: hypothetical protein MUC48_00730 [Leptolyngbya sp. Prado105]|jgi:hypothetical protein|nr:hypothetical protein [Leptolyngbya sp. Prado105]